MKEISKEKIKKLIELNILRNTAYGLVDRKDRVVGFCRTRHHRYIEDKFADWRIYNGRQNTKPRRHAKG